MDILSTFNAAPAMRSLAVAAALIVAPMAAHATTLTATIRNFDDTHPNFGQGAPFQLVTGAVDSTLTGSAPTPVFIEGDRTDPPVNFTTHADFNEWWTGGSDVQAYDMVFNDVGGYKVFDGEAQTPGSQFFPYGAGDYLFTLQVSGFLSFEAGQEFIASSDDDLWIFVDNRLVVDLGGVRAVQSDTFTSADLMAMGLNTGTNYKLDIFFAERNVSHSVLTLKTNMTLSSTPAPIPLPAAGWLLLGGLGALAAVRRRKKADA